MKICFICNEYPPLHANGIGIFVRTLAERLAALGEEVWVLGYGKKNPSQFDQNGVHVRWVTLPYPLYRSMKVNGYPLSIAELIKRHYLSWHLHQLVRARHIDLVESHDFNGPLALKPPCPLVVRLHGSVAVTRQGEGHPDQINPRDRAAERRQIQMADHLVAVSQHIGAATNQVFGLQRAYAVIYNGVDTDTFSPTPGTAIPGKVLFVGNLLWRKGYSFLLQAAPLILESCPQATFDFIGSAGGVHQQQVSADLANLPETARARIQFLGQIPHQELPQAYNRAAVFVFPSVTEAFGLTCVEAMACGRPVVATNRASGPELIQDGVTGLRIDPTDPRALGEAILRLLKDRDTAERYGQNARAFAVQHFSLADLGPRNQAYYQSIV